MLLIHPPLVKPSEPPAGLPKLSGALTAHGIGHTLLDVNMEGLTYLLANPPTSYSDTWTKRAIHKVKQNIASLQSWSAYGNFDRYARAVMDIKRVLERAGNQAGISLSLADYTDPDLSPVKSDDLLRAAEHPEKNIFFPYFSSRLTQIMEKDPVEHALVGISLNYLSQALCSFAIIGFLRRQFPSLKIVLGGSLITSWMSRPTFRNPFAGLVDTMIQGPGEIPLLELCGIERPGQSDYSPSYLGLPLDNYLSPGLILPYAASKGCYWRHCSFCPEKAEAHKFYPVPLSQVLADLAGLSLQHHPLLFHLVDNALSPTLMKTISEDGPIIPWYGFSRITRELTDVDFCKALRASGCVMLKLGLESGDQDVLNSLEKGLDLETASQALRTLHSVGIATYVYLLFGTPAETSQAARITLDYVAHNSLNIDFLNLAIFNMPLDCPEAQKLSTRRFSEGSLSLYTDFTHPSGWGRREVRTFLEKDFKKHPAIRSIIIRQPPFFTSNHAPLFRMGPT